MGEYRSPLPGIRFAMRCMPSGLIIEVLGDLDLTTVPALYDECKQSTLVLGETPEGQALKLDLRELICFSSSDIFSIIIKAVL